MYRTVTLRTKRNAMTLVRRILRFYNRQPKQLAPSKCDRTPPSAPPIITLNAITRSLIHDISLFDFSFTGIKAQVAGKASKYFDEMGCRRGYRKFSWRHCVGCGSRYLCRGEHFPFKSYLQFCVWRPNCLRYAASSIHGD